MIGARASVKTFSPDCIAPDGVEGGIPAGVAFQENPPRSGYPSQRFKSDSRPAQHVPLLPNSFTGGRGTTQTYLWKKVAYSLPRWNGPRPRMAHPHDRCAIMPQSERSEGAIHQGTVPTNGSRRPDRPEWWRPGIFAPATATPRAEAQSWACLCRGIPGPHGKTTPERDVRAAASQYRSTFRSR